MEETKKYTDKRWTTLSVDRRLKEKLDTVMFMSKKRYCYNDLLNKLVDDWISNEKSKVK
jgi:hypothetical protein